MKVKKGKILCEYTSSNKPDAGLATLLLTSQGRDVFASLAPAKLDASDFKSATIMLYQV